MQKFDFITASLIRQVSTLVKALIQSSVLIKTEREQHARAQFELQAACNKRIQQLQQRFSEHLVALFRQERQQEMREQTAEVFQSGAEQLQFIADLQSQLVQTSLQNKQIEDELKISQVKLQMYNMQDEAVQSQKHQSLVSDPSISALNGSNVTDIAPVRPDAKRTVTERNLRRLAREEMEKVFAVDKQCQTERLEEVKYNLALKKQIDLAIPSEQATLVNKTSLKKQQPARCKSAAEISKPVAETYSEYDPSQVLVWVTETRKAHQQIIQELLLCQHNNKQDKLAKHVAEQELFQIRQQYNQKMRELDEKLALSTKNNEESHNDILELQNKIRQHEQHIEELSKSNEQLSKEKDDLKTDILKQNQSIKILQTMNDTLQHGNQMFELDIVQYKERYAKVNREPQFAIYQNRIAYLEQYCALKTEIEAELQILVQELNNEVRVLQSDIRSKKQYNSLESHCESNCLLFYQTEYHAVEAELSKTIIKNQQLSERMVILSKQSSEDNKRIQELEKNQKDIVLQYNSLHQNYVMNYQKMQFAEKQTKAVLDQIVQQSASIFEKQANFEKKQQKLENEKLIAQGFQVVERIDINPVEYGMKQINIAINNLQFAFQQHQQHFSKIGLEQIQHASQEVQTENYQIIETYEYTTQTYLSNSEIAVQVESMKQIEKGSTDIELSSLKRQVDRYNSLESFNEIQKLKDETQKTLNLAKGERIMQVEDVIALKTRLYLKNKKIKQHKCAGVEQFQSIINQKIKDAQVENIGIITQQKLLIIDLQRQIYELKEQITKDSKILPNLIQYVHQYKQQAESYMQRFEERLFLKSASQTDKMTSIVRGIFGFQDMMSLQRQYLVAIRAALTAVGVKQVMIKRAKTEKLIKQHKIRAREFEDTEYWHQDRFAQIVRDIHRLEVNIHPQTEAFLKSTEAYEIDEIIYEEPKDVEVEAIEELVQRKIILRRLTTERTVQVDIIQQEMLDIEREKSKEFYDKLFYVEMQCEELQMKLHELNEVKIFDANKKQTQRELTENKKENAQLKQMLTKQEQTINQAADQLSKQGAALNVLVGPNTVRAARAAKWRIGTGRGMRQK